MLDEEREKFERLFRGARDLRPDIRDVAQHNANASLDEQANILCSRAAISAEDAMNALRARLELILSHEGRVASIAGKVAKALYRLDQVPQMVPLLKSEGMSGLIDAIDSFDPGRNVRLATYAHKRILGAIRDFYRNDRFHGMRVSAGRWEFALDVKGVHDELMMEFDRRPTVEDILTALASKGVRTTREKIEQALDVLAFFWESLDKKMNPADDDFKPWEPVRDIWGSQTPSPEEQLVDAQDNALKNKAIEISLCMLQPKHAAVLILQYYENRTMDEIHEILKKRMPHLQVKVQTVRQWASRGKEKLREILPMVLESIGKPKSQTFGSLYDRNNFPELTNRQKALSKQIAVLKNYLLNKMDVPQIIELSRFSKREVEAWVDGAGEVNQWIEDAAATVPIITCAPGSGQ